MVLILVRRLLIETFGKLLKEQIKELWDQLLGRHYSHENNN
jgi:hypothetical protein